ncbi:uncharacterized protein PHALS_15146 [Plasmopara halstedii]|uniref:Uncharacterized protein n=1 Tax=Plasmopara halstedii TaxID=4781 RepID=A0A0P1B0X4_PLAHL|nr:uncharacterized protein PHALS_15146 [Plasmopara halstedii]CEG48332.1 hypothetical protein PHALS_15146 [Plasmopara halstedii]|eukprot:XP_024584701.1 hypothetical protein PHALS_15146 [Plasmopara halstedii]
MCTIIFLNSFTLHMVQLHIYDENSLRCKPTLLKTKDSVCLLEGIACRVHLMYNNMLFLTSLVALSAGTDFFAYRPKREITIGSTKKVSFVTSSVQATYKS